MQFADIFEGNTWQCNVGPQNSASGTLRVQAQLPPIPVFFVLFWEGNTWFFLHFPIFMLPVFQTQVYNNIRNMYGTIQCSYVPFIG